MNMKLFGIVATMAVSQISFADQCAWLDGDDQKFVTKSAVALINKSADFVEYCEPCKNGGPGKVTSVNSAQFEAAKMNGQTVEKFNEIILNGKGVDLAYLYVRTGSRVFTNLALLVGCPASGVSPVLYTAPGKSPTPVSWEDVVKADRSPSSTAKALPLKK